MAGDRLIGMLGPDVDSSRHDTRAETPDGATLAIGTPVEVRRRFDYSWARGFEIAEVVDTGYRLKRKSDGSILPADFVFEDVRAERRRQGMWWAG